MKHFTKFLIGILILSLTGSPSFASEPIFEPTPIPLNAPSEKNTTRSPRMPPHSFNDMVEVNTVLLAKYLGEGKIEILKNSTPTHNFAPCKIYTSRRPIDRNFLALAGQNSNQFQGIKDSIYLLLLSDTWGEQGGRLGSLEQVNFAKNIFQLEGITEGVCK